MIDDLTTAEITQTRTPAREHWSGLLEQNCQRAPFQWRTFTAETHRALRQQLLDRARAYTCSLEQMAAERHLTIRTSSWLSSADFDEGRPIVLTGHQPVVLHWGLVDKYQVTEEFAQTHSAIGLTILLDTDVGDTGGFLTPMPSAARFDEVSWPVSGQSRETLAVGDGIFRAQHLRSLPALDQLTQRVAEQLGKCQLPAAANRFARVMASYQHLADFPAIVANSIVRRSEGLANGLLELPFSEFCRLAGVQEFLHAIALDAVSFHRVYNDSLNAWRRERKLRNAANPFPNLAQRNAEYELPFWSIDSQSGLREPVWARPRGRTVDLLTADQLLISLDPDRPAIHSVDADQPWLVPRGALITVVFRLLVCDLFVHGLGGHRYDQYTDTLIEKYFHVQPPAFVVASASRYLFANARLQLKRLDELAGQQREFSHHPDRYLGQEYFSPGTEQRLRTLLAEKQPLVETLRTKKAAGQSAADEGRRLQNLQQEIKTVVEHDLRTTLSRLETVSTATRTAIEARDYPWFFFD